LSSIPINKKKWLSHRKNLRGDDVAYSQRVVRAGKAVNGWTYIDVEKPGTYQIALRRFPKESGLGLCVAPCEYPQHPSTHKMTKANDVALHVVSARLKVGNFDQTVQVNKTDEEVVFEVELARGEQRIQSWFQLENDETVTAYYMYVEANQ